VGGRARRYSTTALDALLGLVLLAAYIVGVVGLAALVTWAAIRIFPTKERPTKKTDEPPSDDGSGSSGGAAGRLYRKARRAAAG
jgi:hypothetical protein